MRSLPFEIIGISILGSGYGCLVEFGSFCEWLIGFGRFGGGMEDPCDVGEGFLHVDILLSADLPYRMLTSKKVWTPASLSDSREYDSTSRLASSLLPMMKTFALVLLLFCASGSQYSFKLYVRVGGTSKVS